MALENQVDRAYWNERWQRNEIGWDVGYASPAITEFMAQYPSKNVAIFIPGCGNAYEAKFLIEQGFTNITLLDIAPEAVKRVTEAFKDFSQVRLACEDFFQHQGQYDVIIEQTFFCAIPVARRKEYTAKMANLLQPQGKLIGLLFNKNFAQIGPPFGGTLREYVALFSPFFDLLKMEECRCSIPSRQGSELFIQLTKSERLTANKGLLTT